ncbi:MAG: bifunctional ADP-dependent NAD(P)H-hydrate dehydratase/NAD(P)H-hydrate epimerase [Dethiosulfovibrio peptidovorans]|nr:MAG: bifunctional ADP-dependent NAD(P)H-hydrate dehydratase/NAD(P)H-hydrate epimerase [Dethiosulfovibrio peptidovorans]
MKARKKLYRSAAVQAADRCAVDFLGIPSEVLMENAGIACADAACSMTKPGDRVVVLAGVGSNGGDGFVLARHLARLGREPSVILAGSPERLRGPAALNYHILSSLRIPCSHIDDMTDEALRNALSQASLVVDALLGTGASGAPKGAVLRAVVAAEDASCILAIDGPTGVNLDDGTIPGASIDADATVTMIAEKVGHRVSPGLWRCGDISVTHIGVESSAILDDQDAVSLVDEMFVSDRFPQTSRCAHKTSRGGVFLIAGSPRYSGAAALSALGALRGGAGLCVVAAPAEVRSSLSSIPECIFESLESPSDLVSVVERWRPRCSVAVLGPGLDRSDWSREVASSFFGVWDGASVIDGDGLFYLGELNPLRRADRVLTPHEGEAGRLLGCSSREVATERLAAVDELGRRYGVALLKGEGTLIGDGTHQAVVAAGSQSLAVPGSGDVLSGLVGAFMTRGCAPFEAAAIAAWVHGRAGELMEHRGVDGVLASEIAAVCPSVMGGLP